MMQRTVTAMLASALFALCAGIALAQQPPIPTPMPSATATATAMPTATATPTMSPRHTSPNRTATGGVTAPMGQPNFGQLIAALNHTRATTAQLRTMSGVTTNNIQIVKVSSLVPPGNPKALDEAMARNQNELVALRRALTNLRITATTDNSSISVGQFLVDNKMSVNNVVAAQISGSTITLFIQ